METFLHRLRLFEWTYMNFLDATKIQDLGSLTNLKKLDALHVDHELPIDMCEGDYDDPWEAGPRLLTEEAINFLRIVADKLATIFIVFEVYREWTFDEITLKLWIGPGFITQGIHSKTTKKYQNRNSWLPYSVRGRFLEYNYDEYVERSEDNYDAQGGNYHETLMLKKIATNRRCSSIWGSWIAVISYALLMFQ
ncbi:hypothetical protein CC78DRAFT_573165 [Lojkania enalia]|uniref:Uncharacterized protein n=1 Tax=Lojkania enalia TaxID=147567 RepID=A0A9P4NCP2_9PLEO|nr:hypothetical protein CC78DRAFT_573165 [Didymosphaeria enalia]